MRRYETVWVVNGDLPDEEVKAVVDSLARWLPDNADKTVAVLVPRNLRGVDVINALKARGLDYVEFLSSTSTTRAAAGSIANLLAYLSDPGSARKLSSGSRERFQTDRPGCHENLAAALPSDSGNARSGGADGGGGRRSASLAGARGDRREASSCGRGWTDPDPRRDVFWCRHHCR